MVFALLLCECELDIIDTDGHHINCQIIIRTHTCITYIIYIRIITYVIYIYIHTIDIVSLLFVFLTDIARQVAKECDWPAAQNRMMCKCRATLASQN